MNQMNHQAWQASKRVIVVDNHAIVRRGVRAMVESKPYWEVVGEADCGVDAIQLAEEVRPHIAVMDLSLPRLSGLDAMAEMRLRLPNLAVIILTIYHSDSSLRQALEGGALGYVCKNESEHLIPALDAVALRKPYFSPSICESLAASAGMESMDRDRLTPRERQVVKLAAEGNSNKQIARALDLSIKTVETHRSAAMQKAGARCMADLTRYAARNDIVQL